MTNVFDKAMQKMNAVSASRSSLHPMIEVIDNGRKVLVDSDKLLLVHKQHQIVKFSPSTSVPTTFLTSAASVDIHIQNYSGVLHNLILQLNVSESGGSSSVTPCPSMLFIDKIEFYSDGGGHLIQTIYGDNLFFNTAVLSEEQLSSVSSVNNFDSSYGGVQTIAASGTTRYYMPLIGNFAQQFGGVCLSGLNAYILCRIFSRSSGCLESGSGTFNLAQMTLLAEMEVMRSDDLMELNELYRNNILEKPIIDFVRYEVTQTFNSSTAYQLTLHPFTGNCSYIIGGFRSSILAASAGTRTYSSIGDTGLVELLDATGQSQSGGSGLDYVFLRKEEWPQHWPGTMLQSMPLIVFQFSEEPLQALLHGHRDNGYHYFDSRDQIKITTDNAWSSGTYTFTLYAAMFRHCEIDHGRIVFHKS